MNKTSASARRGSLSLLEQAPSTALAHYSHNDDREAKSDTSTYQTGIVCWQTTIVIQMALQQLH